MNLQTATLEIKGLRFETLKALDVKARESGKSVEECARALIEEGVAAAPQPSATETPQMQREEWLRQWQAMAHEISKSWPAGVSAADVLAEMRR